MRSGLHRHSRAHQSHPTAQSDAVAALSAGGDPVASRRSAAAAAHERSTDSSTSPRPIDPRLSSVVICVRVCTSICNALIALHGQQRLSRHAVMHPVARAARVRRSTAIDIVSLSPLRHHTRDSLFAPAPTRRSHSSPHANTGRVASLSLAAPLMQRRTTLARCYGIRRDRYAARRA